MAPHGNGMATGTAICSGVPIAGVTQRAQNSQSCYVLEKPKKTHSNHASFLDFIQHSHSFRTL